MIFFPPRDFRKSVVGGALWTHLPPALAVVDQQVTPGGPLAPEGSGPGNPGSRSGGLSPPSDHSPCRPPQLPKGGNCLFPIAVLTPHQCWKLGCCQTRSPPWRSPQTLLRDGLCFNLLCAFLSSPRTGQQRYACENCPCFRHRDPSAVFLKP